MTIKGNTISLRSLLKSDAEFIFKWENDKANWRVSDTLKPYSKVEIEDFINNQKDIYSDKQLRLMICLNKNPTDCIGCIDLFNFDAKIKKAGIGILISEEFRKNGFASEALKLLITHCFNKLYLRQLYCNIHADNIASLNLFKKNGFSQIKNENDTLLLEITN